MPDSTRPTRSMFFKVLKSVLSFDGSINRITGHPGGKNVNIIFAYATSLAYDRCMHTQGNKGKRGIDVFTEYSNGISAKKWLEEMGWGGKEEITSYAVFATTELFNSFAQDEVLEISGEEPNLTYKFLMELDYPTDEQIETARKSNKYFMMAMDDLVDQLPLTLEKGKPTTSRQTSTYLPLWEALLADPLSNIFREEMLFQVNENFPKPRKNSNQLNVLEIATGTGSGTVKLISSLINHYEDLDITIHCYEEIANQLNRARERIMAFDKEIKSKYSTKNLTFTYNFNVKKYRDPITLESNTIDLVVSFQNLHYIAPGDRYAFFENMAKMLTPSGLISLAQTTSYSHQFPHPMTMAYLSVEGFNGYPVVDDMKEIASSFFKQVKSSGIDTIWVLSKPKFEYD